jgi:hypothetical protein
MLPFIVWSVAFAIVTATASFPALSSWKTILTRCAAWPVEPISWATPDSTMETLSSPNFA